MASQSYVLVMRTGPNPGKVFELNKSEIVIGRDINNDIVINDPEVSRTHARMVFQAAGFVLEDLGSTNGTFAGGQRLMGPHILRPGEIIMFGENISCSFEVSYEDKATFAAQQAVPGSYPPAPHRYQPPPPQTMPPQTYSGYIPPGSPEYYYDDVPPVEQKSNNTLIWVGCGCLVILMCALVGAAIAFDQLNLYCRPPFNILFPCP